MPRLQPLAITMEAYRSFAGGFRDWVFIAAVPILVSSLLSVLLFAFAPGHYLDGVFESPWAIVVLVLQAILDVMFAIAWLRRGLMGAKARTPFDVVRWQRRHWRYLFKFCLLIAIAILGVSAATISIGAIFPGFFVVQADSPAPETPAQVIMLLFLAAYCLTRFLLVFPAAAVDDHRIGIRGSWKLTADWSVRSLTNLRLFVALALVAGPCGIVLWLSADASQAIFSAFDGHPGLPVVLAIHLVEGTVYYSGFALALTALASAYTTLKSTAPPVVRAALERT